MKEIDVGSEAAGGRPLTRSYSETAIPPRVFQPPLDALEDSEILIPPRILYKGLHIVITEANEREMTANVNPGRGQRKDPFAPDRLSLRKVLDRSAAVLMELDHGPQYSVDDVLLMAPGNGQRGSRTAAIINENDAATLYVRETWEEEGKHRSHSCMYDIEPTRNRITRLSLESNGEVLDPRKHYDGLLSFSGLHVIPPHPTVAEVRQVRQVLQHDILALQFDHDR